MSETVDKKVIELEFKNDNFKKGMSETLDGMKKLKNAFELKGSAKNVEELDSAIKNVDASRMAEGVDHVKAEFSVLGAVGFAAIQRITNAVMDMGTQVLNSFTLKPITDGLEEYTLKMNSIKTIQTNTMGAFENSDEQLEAINETLGDLNHYADKTIYNFAQMTRNVGTFTAAGIRLEDSAQAIKGISNLAAASGSDAQQAATAMYQLSQALSAGTMKLMDWRSVINAGMGGQMFQNALIRTSEAMGTGAMDAIAKQGSFNNSLQEGWATAEVLTKTLRNMTLATNEMTDAEIEEARAMLETEGYSKDAIEEIFREANAAQEAATKVRTFQQLIDTTQEALGSGWAQSWEYIIGDISQSEALFTGISTALNGVIEGISESRNNLLKEWNEGGGRDAIIQGLTTFADIVTTIVNPIKEAFEETFDPLTGQNLIDFSKGFSEFFTSIQEGLASEKGQKFISFIHEFSKAIFELVKFLGTISIESLSGFGDFITGLVSKITDYAFGESSPILDFVKGFSDTIRNISELLSEIPTIDVEGLVSKIKEMLAGFDVFGKFDSESAKNSLFELEGVVVSAVGVFLGVKLLLAKINDIKKASDVLEDAVTEIVDNISGGFKALNKGIKKVSKSIALRNYLVGFGLALVSLATSMYLLSDLKLENIIPNLGVMLVALGILVGMAKLIDKIGFSMGRSIGGAISLILISSCLVQIAKAISMLSAASNGDPVETLAQVGALVIGILGISGALVLVGNLGKRLLRSMLAIRTILDGLMGIALSVSLLSLVTGGDASKSLGQMMVILTGLVGVSVILAVLSSMDKKLIKAGAAINGIVSSMLGISIAVGVLSFINGGDAIKSLSQLGVLLAGLVGVSAVLIGVGRLSDKMIRAAIATRLIVVSLVGVAASIALMSVINSGNALASLAQLGVLIAGIAGTAAVLVGVSRFGDRIIASSIAIRAIVTALLGVGASIALMSFINGGNALASLAQLSVLLVGLVGVAAIMVGLGRMAERVVVSAFAVDLMVLSLIGIAASIALLSMSFGGDIAKIGLSMLVLAGGIAALGLVLTALSGIGPGLILSAAAMIVLSGAVLILSAALAIIAKIPFMNLILAIGGVALAFLAFAGISVVLQPLVPTMLAVAASLTLLGVGLNLIAVAMFTFMSILAAMSTMSVTAFTNIADGIVAFSDRIAEGGDSVVRAASVMGESLAATVTAFIGRIISDVGAGISNLAQTVEGKEGEIFNGAAALGKAFIAGLIGALAGIGEAFLGAIVGGINAVMSQTTQSMVESGTTMSYEMSQAMQDHPEWYQDVGKSNMDAVDDAMQQTDAGVEAGEHVAENLGEGAADALPEQMNQLDVDSAAAQAIENSETSGVEAALQSFMGEAFSSEDLFSGLGDMGLDVSQVLSSGILDGAKNVQIDPASLLGNMNLTSASFDQNATDVGKGIGTAVSNGAAISISDNSPIDAGVQAQLEAVRSHQDEYTQAGTDSGRSYTEALTASLSEGEIEAAILNSQASMQTGVDVAAEAGAQAGQAYGSAQVDALSSIGTLISATVMMNLQSATEGSGAEASGNTAGVLYDGGVIEGLLSGVGELISSAASNFQRAATESDPGGKGYDAGRWFAEGASSGVSDNIGDMSGTVGSAFSDAASDSDPGGKGYNAGRWFAEGMASGIREYASGVAEEAAKMVSDAKAAADAAADSHSPSREMMKRGMWFDQGMAKGIREYSSLVTEAASGMTEGAMDTASSSMSLMGALVDDMDWDADPVISPVLDLEDFEAGASRMNDLMPTSQVVAAAYADRVWSGGASDQVAQNGSSTTIYLTLDWKAGTTANQMASQLARELETWNLTKGK